MMPRKALLIISLLIITIGSGLVFWAKQNQPQKIPNPGPSSAPITAKKQLISGMVVPHHDLVKDERSELFEQVTGKISQPKTIILASPNHYNSGQANVQTTSKTWEITDGTISPNQEVINQLISAQVSIEADSFTNEHGIKLILSDIKKYFPQATIVPLIFKTDSSQNEVSQVLPVLEKACADCLFIASVDFSHYQPALLGDLHDNLTKRALQNRDVQTIYSRSEVDSPTSLALLIEWAKLHQTERFHLERQTNSGTLLKDPDIETTTHLFGWYEEGEAEKPVDSVSFTIGGDMMFGRSIAHTFLADGLWKSLDKLGDRVFWGTDIGIVNVEGPISDVAVPDDVSPNRLIFNFPPETIQALKYLHVNVASLANNHTANQGKKGLETTRRLLDEASIKWVGGPGDADIDKTQCKTGEKIRLCVIGVHLLASQPDLGPVIKSLKAEGNTRVIIFPHWGAEYKYNHGDSQEKLAHAWIDAGADIVIGAHPHVIQDSELYKGKPIIYSLGNLLFDQTFSKETQEGLLVSGEFGPNELKLFALPIQSSKYKPALMRGENKKGILNRLYEPFKEQKRSSAAGEILHFPF